MACSIGSPTEKSSAVPADVAPPVPHDLQAFRVVCVHSHATDPIPASYRVGSGRALVWLIKGEKTAHGIGHQGAGGAMAAPGAKSTCSNQWFFFRIGVQLSSGWWTNISILLQNFV